MTQEVTLDESVKVNLDSETYEKLAKEARKKGLAKSALARTILKSKVEA